MIEDPKAVNLGSSKQVPVGEPQVWDAASVGIDVMALLAGSAIVALLVALFAIWLIALLVKKIDPEFSESVKAWRTELAFGGAIFASTFIFLQVAAYYALVVKKDIPNMRASYDFTLVHSVSAERSLPDGQPNPRRVSSK